MLIEYSYELWRITREGQRIERDMLSYVQVWQHHPLFGRAIAVATDGWALVIVPVTLDEADHLERTGTVHETECKTTLIHGDVLYEARKRHRSRSSPYWVDLSIPGLACTDVLTLRRQHPDHKDVDGRIYPDWYRLVNEDLVRDVPGGKSAPLLLDYHVLNRAALAIGLKGKHMLLLAEDVGMPVTLCEAGDSKRARLPVALVMPLNYANQRGMQQTGVPKSKNGAPNYYVRPE